MLISTLLLACTAPSDDARVGLLPSEVTTLETGAPTGETGLSTPQTLPSYALYQEGTDLVLSVTDAGEGPHTLILEGFGEVREVEATGDAFEVSWALTCGEAAQGSAELSVTLDDLDMEALPSLEIVGGPLALWEPYQDAQLQWLYPELVLGGRPALQCQEEGSTTRRWWLTLGEPATLVVYVSDTGSTITVMDRDGQSSHLDDTRYAEADPEVAGRVVEVALAAGEYTLVTGVDETPTGDFLWAAWLE